jgi:hypothetical protein
VTDQERFERHQREQAADEERWEHEGVDSSIYEPADDEG